GRGRGVPRSPRGSASRSERRLQRAAPRSSGAARAPAAPDRRRRPRCRVRGHPGGRPTGPVERSLDLARSVLRTEAAAVLVLVERLDERFEKAVHLLLDCQGRVIVTGMGKSGIICRKIAATFSSTGTPAFFLHPAEAIHGDL